MKKLFLIFVATVMLFPLAFAQKSGRYVNSREGLNIRAEPNARAAKVGALKYGEFVEVAEEGDGIGEWVMIPVGTNDSDTRWHFSGNGEGGNLKVCLSVENGYQQSKDLYLKNNRVKEAKISIYAAAFSAGQDDAYLLWNPDCIHEEVITLCDEIAPEPFYFNSSYKEFFMSLPEKYSTSISSSSCALRL